MVKLSSKTHRLKTMFRHFSRRAGRRCQHSMTRALRWWRRHDRRWYPWWRVANGLVALLLLAAIVLPVWQVIYKNNRYQLSAAALTLVGKPDQTLQKQLTYDSATATYQFNKSAIKADTSANPLAAMQTQVGSANGQGNNKSLYALDVPTDFTKGVTYHDVNSGLSFGLKPQFSALPGKTVNDHLVFPLAGQSQAVYTLKSNGLKEDIVVNKITSDTMSFSYQFNLPDTLAVKVIPNSDGAIGLYSADPSLFGNMSYGSDSDRAAVEKARVAGAKTYLVFGLPKPVVKDTKGNTVGSARYELNGDKLTVVAEGLSKASGPVTIDPSVVVTSTSDFQTGGNNEGMITFDATNNQITRGGLTGGSIGTWTVANSLPNAIESSSSTTYNGYIYHFGGFQRTSPGTYYDTSSYATINSDGSLGTWLTTTSIPMTSSIWNQTIAYNGYMYLMGGDYSGTDTAEVYYAPINTDGTLGAWVATSSLPQAISGGAATVYNGYLYFLGGSTGSPGSCGTNGDCLNTTYYAPINGNGTLGGWNTTTVLNRVEAAAKAIAYNGYLYVTGGANTAVLSTVDYAPINSDGTLGAWVAGPNMTAGRYGHAMYIYNGYLYVAAGFSGRSDVLYAPIYANGSLGAWDATTSISIGVYLTQRMPATTVTSISWVVTVVPILLTTIPFSTPKLTRLENRLVLPLLPIRLLQLGRVSAPWPTTVIYMRLVAALMIATDITLLRSSTPAWM